MFPVFEKFQRLHLKEQYIFKHYPRCIAASSVYEDEYVLLNDLNLQGFKNSDRPTALHFDKCVAVLKTIAKFHAISFAMKDQQPERLAKLTSKLSEITFTKPINEELDLFLKRNVGYSLTTLDPEKDKVIIKKLMKFRENYASFMAECCAEKEDAIVLHGDCWISNIMFRRNHVSKTNSFLYRSPLTHVCITLHTFWRLSFPMLQCVCCYLFHFRTQLTNMTLHFWIGKEFVAVQWLLICHISYSVAQMLK